MLAHHVFFWLRPDITPEQKEQFYKGLQTLQSIEIVKGIYIGTPVAQIERSVVDKTYSFSLLVIFNGLTEHDAYQVHPVHKAFLATFGNYWEKVVIYDAA